MSTANTPFDPIPQIAAELSLSRASVGAAVRLLGDGATVPFIARYRKEATGGLDESQLRAVEERNAYLLELEARRRSILEEVSSQGKLTPELEAKLRRAATKSELEDLYLPYKPKRRTRATIAKERGLEPLADKIWAQASQADPCQEAAVFVDEAKGVASAAEALQGARDILAERVSENAEIRQHFRQKYLSDSVLEVRKQKAFADQVTKFDNYAEFAEPVSKLPSHRYLAIRRGESEGVLRAGLELDQQQLRDFALSKTPYMARSPWASDLEAATADAVKRLLVPAVEVEVRVELKMRADQAAIGVFAQNLRELLLAAPFGSKTVLGIDPGQRTGCKCVVVDETGKLLANTTVNLVQGAAALERARQALRDLCRRYRPRAVAVGNGTHGRETESFVRDLLREEGLLQQGRPAEEGTFCVPVNEAGASVYSASELAREEFPELDVTVRGAISIARRLQDPLAELVKIDPKSIGVGQYQHDVYQPFLAKKLDEVVESCVNQVGVELNTASAPLLARVAGIGPKLAQRIVAHRDEHGPFRARQHLLQVSGLGPRTFEQCAGFLRVRGGAHPLDGSAVHPERYALVEKMAQDLGVPIASLIGNKELLARLRLEAYEGDGVGSYTLSDILSELDKPGRDPRATFDPPQFRDDVRKLEDLSPGMVLEGIVTNVAAFGAFVDVGVHQDGLVHVSQLADRFVKDPADVVKVGDKLQVRVLEVDAERRRISLSARRGPEQAGAPGGRDTAGKPHGPRRHEGGASRAGSRGPVRPPRLVGAPASPARGPDATFSNNPFARHFGKK